MAVFYVSNKIRQFVCYHSGYETLIKNKTLYFTAIYVKNIISAKMEKKK